MSSQLLTNTTRSRSLKQVCEFGMIRDETEFSEPRSSTFSELFLPHATFNSLFQYVLENQSADGAGDGPFTLTSRNQRRAIHVRNHVGIIETKSGLSLEILPKIHVRKKEDEVEQTKKTFLRMLSHLRNTPFITLQQAHLKVTESLPIFEVFISAFVNELEKLLLRGLRSQFVAAEENLGFSKGKILIRENIRLNHLHANRFFCSFSEFTQDTPENRVIQAAVEKLKRATRRYSSVQALNKISTHFDGIDRTSSLVNDLRSSKNLTRLTQDYATVLEWAQVFLDNKTFANFNGDAINSSVLFPMERVFEDYVAYAFSRFANGYQVKAQDRRYFLVERHRGQPRFQLQPDLYVEGPDIETIVIDTKWKLLDARGGRTNYGISGADMYQLYAYGRKYARGERSPKLIMLYPDNPYFESALEPFLYEDNLMLHVIPFNLNNDPRFEVERVMGSI